MCDMTSLNLCLAVAAGKMFDGKCQTGDKKCEVFPHHTNHQHIHSLLSNLNIQSQKKSDLGSIEIDN